MGTRENKVETYLDTEIKKLGGITRKWTSTRPVPDRICMVPDVGMFAVEVKTVDGRWSSDGQKREFDRINEHGGRAFIVYGHEDVDKLIKRVARKQKSVRTTDMISGLCNGY